MSQGVTEPLFVQCRGGRYGYDWGFEFLPQRMEPITQEQFKQVLEWCTHMFGPSMEADGASLWGHTFNCLLFEDPQMAMMFKLQWC